MRAAAALSRTAEAGVAAAEAADAAGARLDRKAPGAPCDLAVVFVSAGHLDDLEDVAAAVEARLEPGVLIGAVAQGVIGPGEEVESGPGVSVWTAALDAGWVQPFRAWTMRPSSGGLAVAGWPDTMPGDVTLVLADPYSFPVAEVAERIGEQRPGQPILGGQLSAGDGRSRFLLDGRVHDDGAVGVVLRDVEVDPVISQGCRPIGEPFTVTQAVRDRVLELGGEPATGRLERVLADLEDSDREMVGRGGLHLGVVVDDQQDRYETGDFLVRAVLGVEPESGAVTIGDVVPVGATIQFQVRDAASADADLAARLGGVGPASGALLFSCTGRGAGLFGGPDHDVRALEAELGAEEAVAGAFCAGEVGPVGRRSYLHGFTAAVAVFGARAGSTDPDIDVTAQGGTDADVEPSIDLTTDPGHHAAD